jgi:hypothetical protein
MGQCEDRKMQVDPPSCALTHAKAFATSAAVTGGFTASNAALTLLTRSDHVFGRANLSGLISPPRPLPRRGYGAVPTGQG